MNDRSTINARRPEWPGLGAAELRTEERKVLAVLLVYAALILFAILGVKVLDRQMEKQQSLSQSMGQRDPAESSIAGSRDIIDMRRRI